MSRDSLSNPTPTEPAPAGADTPDNNTEYAALSGANRSFDATGEGDNVAAEESCGETGERKDE